MMILKTSPHKILISFHSSTGHGRESPGSSHRLPAPRTATTHSHLTAEEDALTTLSCFHHSSPLRIFTTASLFTSNQYLLVGMIEISYYQYHWFFICPNDVACLGGFLLLNNSRNYHIYSVDLINIKTISTSLLAE